MEQKPSIGRIVWYQRHGSADGSHLSKPSPAIVTDVLDDQTVDLMVFNPNGLYFQKTAYSADAKAGTWRWPDRV
jgi:hypothetical protein